MAFWKSLIKRNTSRLNDIETALDSLNAFDAETVFDRLEEIGAMDYYNTVYTYDENDNLTTMVWKNESNVTLRTDSFTYLSDASTETIIQNIIIEGGGSYVISTLFDLEGNILSVDRTVL